MCVYIGICICLDFSMWKSDHFRLYTLTATTNKMELIGHPREFDSIVKEDNLPPAYWRLGRVIELHPGASGVVTGRCAKGVIKRAANRVCILPVQPKCSNIYLFVFFKYIVFFCVSC